MLWIKHHTAFARLEFMVEIGHELGNSACYGVWLILERIGEAWSGSGMPELRLPIKEWRLISQLPQKKFNKLLEILKAYEVIAYRNEGNKLAINTPILLQLQDEGTRKRRKASGESQEAVRMYSGPDTDKDQNEEKEQNTSKSISFKERRSIANVLQRKGIVPESALGQSLYNYIEKHQPRNPAGYLTSILKNNPHFDPRGELSPESRPKSRQGECLQAGEILERMRFIKQQNGP